jgi:hypothetical protein
VSEGSVTNPAVPDDLSIHQFERAQVGELKFSIFDLSRRVTLSLNAERKNQNEDEVQNARTKKCVSHGEGIVARTRWSNGRAFQAPTQLEIV